MTDKTPESPNELIGKALGLEGTEKVLPINETDCAALGIWKIYYRRPGQKWSLPMTQFDKSTIKVTEADIHMNDFVHDMGVNGNDHFPGWDCAVAVNEEAGLSFAFGGSLSELKEANKFAQAKLHKKGFGK